MTRAIHSSDWRVVEDHIAERIATFHRALEKIDIDPFAAAVMRGRIAELRALTEWGVQATRQTIDPPR